MLTLHKLIIIPSLINQSHLKNIEFFKVILKTLLLLIMVMLYPKNNITYKVILSKKLNSLQKDNQNIATQVPFYNKLKSIRKIKKLVKMIQLSNKQQDELHEITQNFHFVQINIQQSQNLLTQQNQNKCINIINLFYFILIVLVQ
ncbi:unnamed protein product [Paramecium sonneborni]|uniref:Uncharacterized protein n=1 Tax=Paramecium sonneborni TaxID=65129 RepID=A0A8S1QVM2_9CILI|nr:unnamed protein product [Paramecium sonneborni]